MLSAGRVAAVLLIVCAAVAAFAVGRASRPDAAPAAAEPVVLQEVAARDAPSVRGVAAAGALPDLRRKPAPARTTSTPATPAPSSSQGSQTPSQPSQPSTPSQPSPSQADEPIGGGIIE